MATQIKGKIAKLSKNNGGYWQAGIITGEKDGKAVWGNINFADKSEKLIVAGVEIKTGLVADATVEGQYNNFVSGSFKEPEKKPYNGGGKGGWGGKAPFEKKEYDQTGNAVGGAVNRANELLAAKVIKAEDVGVVSLAQYYVSEYLIKAVKAGPEGIKAYHSAFKGVNVLDINKVVVAKNALEEALKGMAPPSPPPATVVVATPQEKPVEAPVQSQAVSHGHDTGNLGGDDDGDGFDDTPAF